MSYQQTLSSCLRAQLSRLTSLTPRLRSPPPQGQPQPDLRPASRPCGLTLPVTVSFQSRSSGSIILSPPHRVIQKTLKGCSLAHPLSNELAGTPLGDRYLLYRADMEQRERDQTSMEMNTVSSELQVPGRTLNRPAGTAPPGRQAEAGRGPGPGSCSRQRDRCRDREENERGRWKKGKQ